MIRGPILPQLRDGLWAVISTRLANLEHGLTLVMEGLDCGGGQLGMVEGLARDAGGSPVLVLLAVDGDALLVARALSAVDFVTRVGDALAAAVPEAHFRIGGLARVLVVGAEASGASLEQVARLPVAGLQVCRLEPFRLAGSERFAVTWLTTGSRSESGSMPKIPSPEFVVAPGRQADWQGLLDLCRRIDPAVRADGDRHWQRITWNGQSLGEVWSERDTLFGSTSIAGRRELATAGDLRVFADQILRGYSLAAGLETPGAAAAAPNKTSPASEPAPASERAAAPRHAATGRTHPHVGAESLRSVLATMRLSPEEYSALGGTALSAGEQVEPAVLADGSASMTAVDQPRPSAKPT